MNSPRRLRWSWAAPALLAVPLVLAGCAASDHAASDHAAASQGQSMARMSMAPGRTMAGEGTTGPAAAPPETAAMVCGEEISSKVVQVLGLSGPPATRSTWVNSVFTCTYDLPMGPMVLSVQVAAGDAAAGTAFDADRSGRPQTQDLPGLGQRAFGTPDGVTVVLKDDQVLTVDATALPQVFGANQQHRTDLANEIASDVLGCWTGDGDE
jgi:hypothetical protein